MCVFVSEDVLLVGLEWAAPELMLVENDDVARRLLDELEALWQQWNAEFYVNMREARTRQLIAGRQ